MKYPLEMKQKVLREFYAGATAPQLVDKYNISSAALIYQWQKKYGKGKKHTSAKPNGHARPASDMQATAMRTASLHSGDAGSVIAPQLLDAKDREILDLKRQLGMTKNLLKRAETSANTLRRTTAQLANELNAKGNRRYRT